MFSKYLASRFDFSYFANICIRFLLACISLLSHYFLFRKSKTGISGILIWKTDGIGDFILSIGAIRKIESIANKRLLLVVSEPSRPLAMQQFLNATVISLPFCIDKWKGGCFKFFLAAYRHLKPFAGIPLICLQHTRPLSQDIALCWLNSSKSAAISRSPLITPAKIDYFKRFRPSIMLSYPENSTGMPLEIEAHTRLINAYFQQEFTSTMLLPSLEGFKCYDGGQLIIFPATRSQLRNYPGDRLVASIASLPKGMFDSVIFCGSPEEREQACYLADLYRQISGRTAQIQMPADILEVTKLIAESRAVLGMESAPAHIATALDKPGVFLLGGGHYGFFAPWGNLKKQIWLSTRTDCYNCNWSCPYPEPYCLTRISERHISEALVSAVSHSR